MLLNLENLNLKEPQFLARSYAVNSFSTEEAAVLDALNREVGAVSTLEGAVDYVYEAFRNISHCDRIGITFLEDDGRHLVAYYTKTSYEPVYLKKGYAADINEGSLRAVIEKGKPRIIADLREYYANHPTSETTRLLLKEGVLSSMTCPLSVGGRHVGIMFLSSREANVFDENQLQLFLAAIDRISQTVEKTYQLHQLEVSKRAYNEILSFVSHELKNPVASIISVAGLLADGFYGQMTGGQKCEVDKILKRGDYLISLIRGYLDMANLDQDELFVDVKENVDFVKQVIDPVLEIVQPQIAAKEMRLIYTMEDIGPVRCDPDLLKIVVVNLLSNGVKYGYPKCEIRLTWQIIDDKLTVSVFNEGPGFPQTSIPELFRKFSRLKIPELQREKGTGVGLHNAWRVVNQHNGRIWAESEQGKWAKFTFEIPQSSLN